MVTYISFSSCGVYKLPLMCLFVFITLSLEGLLLSLLVLVIALAMLDTYLSTLIG